MQRRVLIGLAVTAAAAAFALVPTDSLRLVKPQKPLFFYLVPLLRVQVCSSVNYLQLLLLQVGMCVKKHTRICEQEEEANARLVITGTK